MFTAPLGPTREPPVGDCSATMKVSSTSGMRSLVMLTVNVCWVVLGSKLSVVKLKGKQHCTVNLPHHTTSTLIFSHWIKVLIISSCAIYGSNDNSNGSKRGEGPLNNKCQTNTVFLYTETALPAESLPHNNQCALNCVANTLIC